MASIKPIDCCVQTQLNMTFPAAQAAGLISALPGLSNASWRLTLPDGPCVVRTAHGRGPRIALRRHYRALQRITLCCGPMPIALHSEWMLHQWLTGVTPEQIDPQALAPLLHRIHAGSLLGWRISLWPLLFSAWQQAEPARRHVRWLQALHRLARCGEPRPMRLAPLHMDVHCGNLITTRRGLQLLDWEYAGDGDIALELAACSLTCDARDELVIVYADYARLPVKSLQAAVQRWHPWVQLLMASWYECRWQQTQEARFIHLADAVWQTQF